MNLKSEFPTRPVQLCDGRPGLRAALAVETLDPAVPDHPASSIQNPVSSIENPASSLDFITSTETLDRYDEIITADGWRLDNYRRNPVFQNAHQYGDILFTLGRALLTEVRSVAGRSVLFQRIQFATDVNPMARIAYGLYRNKFLNAVSVGFIPLRWEDGGPKDGFRRKYLEQELLEVSAVGIPANPDALQLAFKAGALGRSDLHELAELLREWTAKSISSAHPERLSLARALRRILTKL